MCKMSPVSEWRGCPGGEGIRVPWRCAQSRTVQCGGSHAQLQCNCRPHRFLKCVDDYCLVVATRFRSMEIHTSVKLIRACWDAGIGLLGSNASGAIKGLFYRCFQVSWAKTIDLHQIMSAWRESAISPQDKTVTRACHASQHRLPNTNRACNP